MVKGCVLSKPKFIGRVLDAIYKLSEKHGSSAKNILNFVLKNSKTINRNLTVQIQHALKRAVSEGLIELVGSRYKLRRDRQKQEAAAAARKSVKASSTPEQPPPPPPVKLRRTKRKKSKIKEKISDCTKDSGSGSSKKKGKGSGSGKPSSSRSQSKTNKKNPSVK